VPNAEDLCGSPEFGFADTRQIVARTNVARFTAIAARRAEDADFHPRSRVPGDRATGDECLVVRMSQKEEQTSHGSIFAGGIVKETASGQGAGMTRYRYQAYRGDAFRAHHRDLAGKLVNLPGEDVGRQRAVPDRGVVKSQAAPYRREFSIPGYP